MTPYKQVKVSGKIERLHRKVAVETFGPMPPGFVVDHINGNKRDNRPENLRVISHGLNLRNSGPPRNNTSGYRGVSKSRSGKWRAYANHLGNRHNLGTFETPEEAADAYDTFALSLDPLAWTNKRGFSST